MTTKPKKPLNWHTLLLVGALIVAFALRLSQPQRVEFKRDEATVARLGQAIAYEGYRPAVGVDSSLGIDNLPLTLYLVALPLRLWADPLAAVLFTALLNALAVAACYALGRAYLDERAALIATWLFAVSPWAVLYARKIWCRTLPLFTLALMAALLAAIVKGKRAGWIAAFAGLAALLGLQLEALAFVPIVGLAMVLYPRRLAWRPLLVGIAVCALLLAPYAVHDALHGWENARGLLAYAGGESRFSWDALRYALMLTGSQGIAGQAGPYHEQFRTSLPNLWWLNTVVMGLTLTGVVYALVQAVRGTTPERRRTFGLLLLWFAVPVALQLRPSSATQLHYYVMLYPVRFLLVGALLTEGLDWIAQLRPHGARMGWGVLIGGLLIWGSWQIAVTAQLRAYMVEYPSTGGYGIPLRYTRAAALAAREQAEGAEIIVIGEATEPLMTETPTVFDALLFGHPHRFTDGRSALPVPDAPRSVYLAGPVQSPPGSELGAVLARLDALPSTQSGPAVTLPDGWRYPTWVRAAAAREDITAGMTPLAAGIPLANKAVFAAAELPAVATPGAAVEVWLAWWLQGPPPAGEDYHLTVQLFDSAGEMRAQDDHAGFPSASWRGGDLVLSRFVLRLPSTLAAGTYQVRAGMYNYPDIVPVPVLGPGGNPVDDGVILGQLTVTP